MRPGFGWTGPSSLQLKSVMIRSRTKPAFTSSKFGKRTGLPHNLNVAPKFRNPFQIQVLTNEISV